MITSLLSTAVRINRYVLSVKYTVLKLDICVRLPVFCFVDKCLMFKIKLKMNIKCKCVVKVILHVHVGESQVHYVARIILTSNKSHPFVHDEHPMLCNTILYCAILCYTIYYEERRP